MGIPIIGEIWDGILFLIDFFFNKAPKPIQLAMFLLFLLLLGSLIPFTMHLFGIHCTSAGDVVKISPMKLTKNIKLAFLDKDDIYNVSEFQPDTIGFLPLDIGGESCVKPICHDEDDFWFWQSTNECDNKTIIHPFLTKRFDWQKCVVCDGDENFSIIHSSYSIAAERETLCFGDAYRIAEEDMNFVQRMFCDPESRCMPPLHYYYNYTTGKFTCLDLEYCAENVTNQTIIPRIDEELKEGDAELMYKDTKKDYKKLLFFKCDKKCNPQLTIYGIPFLDYKMWLLIFVVGVMFLFLRSIKKH